MNPSNQVSDRVLWLGDAITYIAITLIGFSSHKILGSSAIVRILATLVPFYFSWLLFSLWGGVSRVQFDELVPWLLRSGGSAVLSAPFAATLRAFWLGAPVLPTFVLVMAGVSAVGIILWRTLFHAVIRSRLTG